jgi:hypothetical protein
MSSTGPTSPSSGQEYPHGSRAIVPSARVELLQDTITELTNSEKLGYDGGSTSGVRDIASFWTTYLSGRTISQEEPLSAADICTMMELLKISRKKVSPGRKDHWKDTCGYASLGWQSVVEDGDAL